jgi:hypothetical protein
VTIDVAPQAISALAVMVDKEVCDQGALSWVKSGVAPPLPHQAGALDPPFRMKLSLSLRSMGLPGSSIVVTSSPFSKLKKAKQHAAALMLPKLRAYLHDHPIRAIVCKRCFTLLAAEGRSFLIVTPARCRSYNHTQLAVRLEDLLVSSGFVTSRRSQGLTFTLANGTDTITNLGSIKCKCGHKIGTIQQAGQGRDNAVVILAKGEVFPCASTQVLPLQNPPSHATLSWEDGEPPATVTHTAVDSPSGASPLHSLNDHLHEAPATGPSGGAAAHFDGCKATNREEASAAFHKRIFEEVPYHPHKLLKISALPSTHLQQTLVSNPSQARVLLESTRELHIEGSGTFGIHDLLRSMKFRWTGRKVGGYWAKMLTKSAATSAVTKIRKAHNPVALTSSARDFLNLPLPLQTWFDKAEVVT